MGTIEKSIDRSKDLTSFTASDALTAKDFRECMIAFYEGYITQFILWDLTKADLSAITNDEIWHLADQTKQVSTGRKGGKTAFVFDSQFGYGLGRMFEILMEMKDMPFELRAFESVDEAKKWLGV